MSGFAATCNGTSARVICSLMGQTRVCPYGMPSCKKPFVTPGIPGGKEKKSAQGKRDLQCKSGWWLFAAARKQDSGCPTDLHARVCRPNGDKSLESGQSASRRDITDAGGWLGRG